MSVVSRVIPVFIDNCRTSMSIVELVPIKKDHELEIMRRNALNTFNSTDDPKRRFQADELLHAIEEDLEKRHLPGMFALADSTRPNA